MAEPLTEEKPLPLLEELVSFGIRSGVPFEKSAEVAAKWRKTALDKGKTLAAGDAERYWKGASIVDEQYHAALAGLQNLKQQEVLAKAIPEPVEQEKFLNTLKANKYELPSDAPEEWKVAEKAIQEVAASPIFRPGFVSKSKIDTGSLDLGEYEIRTGSNPQEVEAIVRPKKGKPFIRSLTVNREELKTVAKEKEEAANADLNKNVSILRRESYKSAFGIEPSANKSDDQIEQELSQLETDTERSDEPFTANYRAAVPALTRAAGLEEKQKEREFVEKASEGELAHAQVGDLLKKDTEFLATVPQNNIEQYTSRVFYQAAASVVKAGRGVYDKVRGSNEGSGAFATRVDRAAEKVAPGRAATRFAEDGTPIGDYVSQGLESALLLAVPGGLAAKGASRSAAAWGTFTTSAYGAAYGGALQEADAIQDSDPVRAQRIRDNAQFAALTSATLEFVVEKIPGPNVESSLLKGTLFKGVREAGETLGGRAVKGAGTMLFQAAREYSEEFLQASLENIITTSENTGLSQQDPLEAGKGGFFGSLPLVGLGALRRAASRAAPKLRDVAEAAGTSPGALQQAVERGIASGPSPDAVTQAGAAIIASAGETPIAEVVAAAKQSAGVPIGEAPQPVPVEEVEESAPVPVKPVGATKPQEPQDVVTPAPVPGEPAAVPAPAPEPAPAQAATTPVPENLEAEEEATFLLKNNPGLVRTETVPDRLREVAATVERRTGAKVVFVRGEGTAGAARAGGKAVIVNLDSPQNVAGLVWHEAAHTLEKDQEVQEVFAKIKTNSKFSKYSAALQSLPVPYAAEEIPFELQADLLGEFGRNRSFQRFLEQEAPPSVLQKIYDTVLDTLDRMIETVKGVINPTGRQRASSSVENLQEIRNSIAAVLKKKGATNLTQGDRVLQTEAAPVRDSRDNATREDFKTSEGIGNLLKKSGWAILTAENPNAVATSPAENAKLLKKLKEDLKAKDIPYMQAIGQYGSRENSLIVLDPDMSADRAQELATQYAQESVLTKEGLVYANGDILPASGVEVFDTKPDDFYTQIGDITFSVEFGREFGDPLKAGTPENSALRTVAQNANIRIVAPRKIDDDSPKLTDRKAVRDFIETNFLSKVQQLGASLVPNLSADAARYIFSGVQGTHYIEYNPNSLAGETENSLRAVMREEMIHAAEGMVLRRRSPSRQAYIDHYTAITDSLSPEDRKAVKAVYSRSAEKAVIGAEYSRMVIQQALYGELTEQWRSSPKALQKIADMIRSAILFLRKMVSDKPTEIDSVIREAMQALRKIDAAAARAETGIRASMNLPARFKGGRLVFSTRAPAGKDAGTFATILKADLAAMEEDETFTAKVAAALQPFPQVVNARLRKPESVIRELIVTVKGNLRFLWDLMPDEFRPRARKWYDGAHALANDISSVTGLAPEQVAGIMAVLSPQKDWFQNVSLAERVIVAATEAERTNPEFTEKMREALVEFTLSANRTKIATAMKKAGEVFSQEDEIRMREEIDSFAGRVFNKRWADMSLMEKAVYVRAYDTVNHSRFYATITPEGDKGNISVTEGGKQQKVAWGSYSEIAKAISIFYDGTPANISKRLGGAHKVRNFFNNISDPTAEEDFVTIDTHAVAAALLEPLSGNSPQVAQIFSSAKRSKKSGLAGPYAVYAQAYQELADELSTELGSRVFARELQSVTWETVRLLFTRGQKREAFQKMISSLWTKHKKGGITADELRQNIKRSAGGIGRPAWSPAQQELAFDESPLPEGNVFPGVPGVPGKRGDSSGNPGGTPRGDSSAIDGLVEAAPIRRSVSFAKRKFRGSNTSESREVTTMNRIASVVDKFVPLNKVGVSSERAVLRLLSDLRDKDPALNQKLAKALRVEFSDRLAELPANERDGELVALRAIALQVVINNAVRLSSRFDHLGGKPAVQKENRKRAARILASAVQTAASPIIHGSLDIRTAARVVRAAQSSADGDVAAILDAMIRGRNAFLAKQTGLTPEDLDTVTQAGKESKSSVATDVVLDRTEEGREVLAVRERVKSKLRKVASWFGITSDSRENLPLTQKRMVAEIRALLEKINIDYRGNIEELITKLDAAVEELSGAEQVQALLDLRSAVRADERLAHQEFQVLGDSLRKLDAAAQRFIDDNSLKYRFGTTKESQILAKIRTQVRAGKMTPEQGGDAFTDAKGNKLMRAALVDALERDKNSITQQEELEADAAKVDAMIAEEEDSEDFDDPAQDVLAVAEKLLERELSRKEFAGKRGTTALQDATALLRAYATADPAVSKEVVMAAYAAAGISDIPQLDQALNIAEGARLLRRDALDRAASERYLRKVSSAEASQAASQRAKEASLAQAHADTQAAAVRQAEGLALKALGVAKTEKARTARAEAAAARSRFITGKVETEESVRAAYERAGYTAETIDTIIPILQVAREANREAREKVAEKAFFKKSKEAAEDRTKKAADRTKKKADSLVDQGQQLINRALGIKPRKSGKTTKAAASSLLNQYVHSKAGVTKDNVLNAQIAAAGIDTTKDLTDEDIRIIQAIETMVDYAEGARLLRRDEDQDKAAKKFAERSAKGAKKEAGKIESLAKSVFAGKSGAKTGRKTSLEEDILNTVNDNPEWDISDVADKIKIIQEILIRRSGLSEADAAAQAAKFVDKFNEKMAVILKKQADKLAKKLVRGKVTENDLRQAIRLHLLDPSSPLATTLAATKGWKGLSESQLKELSDLLEKVEDIHNPQVRLSVLIKQMRIVQRASGVEPKTSAIISGMLRANMYSRAGSILLNLIVPPVALSTSIVREFVHSVVTKPGSIVEITRSTLRSLAKAARSGLNSAGLAAKYDATLGLSAAKDTAGPESVGVLAVDPLAARFDLAWDRVHSSTISRSRKTWETVVMAFMSGRIMWKIFGAADSTAIGVLTEFYSSMQIDRDLRKEGRDPQQEWEAFMETVTAGARFGVDVLGLTPMQAHGEILTRAREAYYEFLTAQGSKVSGLEIHAEGRREALSILGNHEEVQGTISRAGKFIADTANKQVFRGLGVLGTGPVKIIAQVNDYLIWHTPIYGIVRYIREKAAQKKGEGRFPLHAGSERQLQRRLFSAISGNIITGTLIALLAAQDDDDPWFEITLAYPTDAAKRQEWAAHNLTEFTMYFGSRSMRDKRPYVRFTRGAYEALTYPAITAEHINELRKGKNPATVSANTVYNVTSTSLPAIASLASSVIQLERGSPKEIYREVATRFAAFQPLSGAASSIAKLKPAPSKDDSAYLWSQAFPAIMLFQDGKIELRNALNESVTQDEGFWGTMARLGLPLGFVSSRGTRDEVLRKDFSEMNYPIPFAPSAKQLFENDPWTAEQYNKLIELRAAAFKSIYREDPEPGDAAKDGRSLKTILRVKDREAYKERLSLYWSKATKRAKVKMGLTEE